MFVMFSSSRPCFSSFSSVVVFPLVKVLFLSAVCKRSFHVKSSSLLWHRFVERERFLSRSLQTCATVDTLLPWARGHDFASRQLSPRGVCAPWFSSSSQSRFQINSAQPQTLCLGFDHWVVMAMQFGSMTTKTKEEDCSGNEVEQI